MLTELEEPNKYEHPSDKWALQNMDARAYFCQHGKISPSKNAGYDNLFFPVKYKWQGVWSCKKIQPHLMSDAKS